VAIEDVQMLVGPRIHRDLRNASTCVGSGIVDPIEGVRLEPVVT
jgi:hypothetical protein